MIVNNSIVKIANDAFKKGDYSLAKKNYKLASEKYGLYLFYANIELCDKRIKGSERGLILSLEETDINTLENKNRELELKIKEKDACINERFRELAVLTQMLEGK